MIEKQIQVLSYNFVCVTIEHTRGNLAALQLFVQLLVSRGKTSQDKKSSLRAEETLPPRQTSFVFFFGIIGDHTWFINGLCTAMIY